MNPRSSVAQARKTRAAIIGRALEIASVDGLEGLTIGRLAAELGMSKSGVLGQFGTKESLQIAVVEAAAELFDREVSQRAAGAAPGLDKLLSLCAAWVSLLDRAVLPGGCFFAAASAEFDDRDGPVRDTIAALTGVWLRELRQQVRLAVAAGDLPAGTDPDQIVFELSGQILALNHGLRMHRDPAAVRRTLHAMGRLLGRVPTAAGWPAPGSSGGWR